MSTFDELAGGIVSGDGQLDSWIIVKKSTGEYCGRGTSATRLADDEEFRWIDGERALNEDPFVIDKRKREQAQREIDSANARRDPQVYIDKAAQCSAFLIAEAENEAIYQPYDENGNINDGVIDPVLYKLFHAEYWATFAVSKHTPWTLARAVQSKSDKSIVEAERRRTKLLAQAVLDAPAPDISTERQNDE